MRSTTPSFSMDTHFEPWKKYPVSPDVITYIKVKMETFGWVTIWRDHLCQSAYGRRGIFSVENSEGGRMQAVVHCFCLDSWNRLWVGTSNGLVQIDPKTHGCKNIKLPGEIKNVFAITEDKEGNVWVGTDKGLKRIETNGDQIRVEGNYERRMGWKKPECEPCM